LASQLGGEEEDEELVVEEEERRGGGGGVSRCRSSGWEGSGSGVGACST
jgi:hypothetical protein